MADADPIELRPPMEADRAAWQTLWQAYQAFYRADISAAVSDVTWRRLRDPAEPMWAVLAHAAEQPVGLVHWIRHRSCWTTGDYVYLQDLFVAPGSRGGGIGRRLIAHVYAEAQSAGCARVYWLTHETNQAAMRLYDQVAERSGFVQYRKLLG